jgi:hypothetical protein
MDAFAEAYKAIFETTTGKQNESRLNFLREVSNGYMQIDGKPVKLEDIVRLLNHEKPLAEETKSARAMYAMRKWYEKPEEDHARNAKFYAERAGLQDVVEWFDHCLGVLKVYKMRQAFDAAIEYAKKKTAEQEKADIVHLAASALLRSGISALSDYVMDKMPAYAKKYHFNQETWKAERIREPQLQHAHK